MVGCWFGAGAGLGWAGLGWCCHTDWLTGSIRPLPLPAAAPAAPAADAALHVRHQICSAVRSSGSGSNPLQPTGSPARLRRPLPIASNPQVSTGTNRSPWQLGARRAEQTAQQWRMIGPAAQEPGRCTRGRYNVETRPRPLAGPARGKHQAVQGTPRLGFSEPVPQHSPALSACPPVRLSAPAFLSAHCTAQHTHSAPPPVHCCATEEPDEKGTKKKGKGINPCSPFTPTRRPRPDRQ